MRPRPVPRAVGGASPLARVHAGAPPSFVIHGTFDSLSPVGQARAFVSALRAAGAPVAELPAAQHAFDTFHSVRSAHVADGVARWLAALHERHLAGAGHPAQHDV
ncbi:MAG TPA: hypothetical protein VD926_05105 [Acidimicrobiales bacterium]|nr:hypothetical protein [Acidimicrobiales bacterium]